MFSPLGVSLVRGASIFVEVQLYLCNLVTRVGAKHVVKSHQ